MYRLLLWDVDGTILSTDGLSGQAMRAAMARVFGPLEQRERTFYSGKTDRQIIQETFPDLNDTALLEQLAVFSQVYIEEFEQRRLDLLQRTSAMPGVVELIAAFHGQILQAPLTGNIAPIAQRKVELLNLLPYLTVAAGAYGDDHHDRAELVPIAAQRAAGLLGQPLQGCQIIVVGDTPNDIRCGKRSGARTVAVATGPYSVDELRSHGPDAVLPDLSDTAAARVAIFGQSGADGP